MAMTNEQIAQVCHEADRAYLKSTSPKGKDLLPTWSKASAERKALILAYVEYLLANPDATQSTIHDIWMQRKTDASWTYGTTLNKAEKKDPALVAYDQLPEKRRARYQLMINVIKSNLV